MARLPSWPKIAELERVQKDAIEVLMTLVSRRPTCLGVPQPHLHSADAPLRRDYLRRVEDYGSMDWEDWRQLGPRLRRRPVPAGGVMLITVFGRQAKDDPADGELVGPAKARRSASQPTT